MAGGGIPWPRDCRGCALSNGKTSRLIYFYRPIHIPAGHQQLLVLLVLFRPRWTLYLQMVALAVARGRFLIV